MDCILTAGADGETIRLRQDLPSFGKCQAAGRGMAGCRLAGVDMSEVGNDSRRAVSRVDSVRAGDVVELRIGALASDGRGIGRLTGQDAPGDRDASGAGLTVFVGGALPGQMVRARITTVRKRLAEADVTAVVRPSPEEREALCPHGGRRIESGTGSESGNGAECEGRWPGACGGCPWQGLRYDRQLFWKERILRDALERVGRLEDPPVLPVLASPREWGCRNKMEFAFAPVGEGGAGFLPGGSGSGGGLVLGLRERASRRVTPVTGCLMQSGRTMRLLEAMRGFAADEGLSAWNPASGQGLCRFLVTREPVGEAEATPARGAAARACLAELIVGPDLAADAAAAFGRRVAAALREAVPDLTGFVLSRRAAASDVAYGETTLYREGETRLTERIGPLRVELGHDAFFQVNTAAASLLYAEAARMADAGAARRFWDVYCGVGSLGLYLLKAGGLPRETELTGIETMPGGVRMARRNAAALGLERCRFVRGDAADVLRRLPGVPDVMTVDPPRAGLAPAVIRSILRVMPARLVYVSCNPATLARDAALLAPGFRLCRTRPVDLFPQTPHVESVSLFVPR